jgi:hypothetical protein
MNQEHWTTLDAFISGFLVTQGFTPSLISQNGNRKIAFSFPSSPELYKALNEYNNGALIEASRFALTVKALKSQIFSMKTNNEQRSEDSHDPRSVYRP